MSSSTPRQAGSTRSYFIFFALVAVAALAIWGLVSRTSEKNAAGMRRSAPPVAVGTSPVIKGDLPLEIKALGTVNSTYTVTVRSRVDGTLDQVFFTEGQTVKAGQLLAQIDPRPYQAALAQAQGQLMRDQAQLRSAEQDLARYKQLLAQNSIAAQQVDTQQALVDQLRGTVKADEGSVANAQLQLTYSRVTAPVGGRVGLRQVDPGNVVHASDANGIVVITQTQPINMVFAIPEPSLSAVLEAYKANPKLKVQAWDRDDRKQISEGELLAIDNQLNAGTGSVSLKAKFANAKEELFPNQFVNARLQLGVREGAIAVPTVAIQLGKVGTYVYVLNADKTVSLAPVKPGPVSGDNTIIESGLHPGQIVVIDGLDKLRDGMQVAVVDRKAQKAEADAASKSHRKHGSGASGAEGGNWHKKQAE